MSIDTLVSDIQDLLVKGVTFSEEEEKRLGHATATAIKLGLENRDHQPGLRMSKLGAACNRQLWYSDHPDSWGVKESLSPATKLKFTYGHILEEEILFLVEKSGHKVERRQDSVDYMGVPGHIDCLIDDELVDVKSANSRSYDKFKKHQLREDDPFGYLTQLEGYYRALGLKTGRFHFLAIDKELGHICLDTYAVDEKRDLAKEIAAKQLMLKQTTPPPRLPSVPDGKSGNEQLGLNCRYCEFKKTCWPEMRSFLYSSGPRHLVKVAREPDVPELKA